MNRRQLIRAVKAASLKIQEEDWPMGSQREREMIVEWRQIRPKMVARLESMGILNEFAHLIESRRFEAMEQYQKAGMGWPDSREQANLDWLIVEPETEEDLSDNALLERLARAEPDAPQPRMPVDQMPSRWATLPSSMKRKLKASTPKT